MHLPLAHLPNIFLPFPLRAALVLLAGLLINRMPAAGKVAPDVIRVACVGDSITQGVHVRGEDNYPSVLGRLLGARYQVGNFGYLGGHDERVIGGEIVPIIREVAAEKKLPLIDIHAAFEAVANLGPITMFHKPISIRAETSCLPTSLPAGERENTNTDSRQA